MGRRNRERGIKYLIADFHIHSKYSRATSKHCEPEMLDVWARQKGLDLIGTGDFTHAAWREELRERLVPAEEGLYTLGKAFRQKTILDADAFAPRFMVSGEISCIYKKNGRVRKVHSVILLPSLEAADALSKRLEAIGNLHSDGRPILGLDCRDLLEIALDTCPEAFLIPAHIWTPHFSLFGAYSGFDDIHECFEDLSGHIHALETGLSSDPPMNWRLSALDRFTLVSNSDAHSPANLAREANLFETQLSYPGIIQALSGPSGGAFRGTIEFFPEEGKYHYDGHRNCGVFQKPADTIAAEGVCPVCGGRVTVGVLHRVERLADRPEGFTPEGARPFESLVPLAEVIAASTGASPASKQGQRTYQELLRRIGPELFILRLAPLEDIERRAGALVAEGIRRLRAGRVDIRPGYDGEYGKISIISKEEAPLLLGQLSLLGTPEKEAPVSTAPSTPKPASKREKAGENTRKEAPPDRLNPEQEQAVSCSQPAVAVVAGPGTGKTKTLVSRIASLIQSGVPAREITAVTFTNKAAAEMRARLEKLLGGKQKALEVNIGTFHGICLRLLAAQGQPVIIDEINARMLVKELLEERGLKKSARDVLSEISLIKNGAKALGQADAAMTDLYEAYCARLAQYGVLDYDDILLRAYADDQCAAFPYLFVDEFQDTNPLQYKLLCKWSKNGKALFVIGDPDQSIYGFRGSDPNCFAWIARDFPALHTIRLTRNYRSTPEILRCAAGVLRSPALNANRESGTLVQLLRADTPFAEALFVAKEINRLVGGMDMLDSGKRGERGFSDIAVLYRTNRQAQQLEQCLAQEGIPYTVTGRDDLLAAPEVQSVLAFFRYLRNPGDRLSLRISSIAFGERLPALLGVYMPLAETQPPEPLLRAFIEAEIKETSPALDKLLDTAVCYGDQPSFLHNLMLGQESDVTRRPKKAYASDAVSLMTLHAAKGLEFPAIFLCGVTEGLLPYEGRGGTDPEEERRLFYVGVTRAQEALLLLTGPNPSPFLNALPEGSLRRGEAFAHKPAPDFVQMRLF